VRSTLCAVGDGVTTELPKTGCQGKDSYNHHPDVARGGIARATGVVTMPAVPFPFNWAARFGA
jgi:hypothetical protein